jgi:hypothetical protein
MTDTSKEAVEAAAKMLSAWIGYSWDGLNDRDISDRYPDWNYSGCKGFQGGKPALRKIAAQLLEALAAERDALRGKVEQNPNANFLKQAEALDYAVRGHRLLSRLPIFANALEEAYTRGAASRDQDIKNLNLIWQDQCARTKARGLAEGLEQAAVIAGAIADDGWDGKFNPTKTKSIAESTGNRIAAAIRQAKKRAIHQRKKT